MTETIPQYPETSRFTPESAVAEAVMFAVGQTFTKGNVEAQSRSDEAGEEGAGGYIYHFLDRARDKDNTIESISASTAQLNGELCLQNSLAALYFIEQQAPDLFAKKAILKGIGTLEKEFLHRMWLAHYYLLLQDKDGLYYAFSPANYSPKDDFDLPGMPPAKDRNFTPARKANRLNTIITGRTPAEIISQIEKIEGGSWSDPEFIAQELKSRDTPVHFEESPDEKPEIAAHTTHYQGEYLELGRDYKDVTLDHAKTVKSYVNIYDQSQRLKLRY